MSANPLLAPLALCALAAAQDQQPPEFGAITWRRDYAAAAQTAARQDKPLLLLFQEVPG